MNGRQFRRVTQVAWIGGVCAGLAYFLGIPTWIVRLVWFLIASCYGFGVLLYILLWIFVPKWDWMPHDYRNVTGG